MVSWSMKRPTLVPASTVVRMNRASNMIAKWYQNALRASPPNAPEKMVDMPTARVGAPPVRAIEGLLLDLLGGGLELVGGDGEAEVGDRLRGRLDGRPDHPGRRVHGEVEALVEMEAAIMAITATNDSVSMAP